MKKLIISLLGIGMGAVLLSGCDLGESNSNHDLSNKNMQFMTSASISGVDTVCNYHLENTTLALASAKAKVAPTTDAIDQAVQAYENTKALFETTIQSETIKSDKEGYLSAQRITYNGNVYQLYIRESNESTEQDEFKMHYNGIVLFNEVEYSFYAKFTSETEEDEKEEKNQFRIFVDDDTYVSIQSKKEIELDEQETSYEYKVVKNKKVIDSFKAQLEVEGLETELKVTTLSQQYKFKSATYKGVEYLRVKNGQTQFTLELKDGSYVLSDRDFNQIEDFIEAEEDKKDTSDDAKDDLDDDDTDDDDDMII